MLVNMTFCVVLATHGHSLLRDAAAMNEQSFSFPTVKVFPLESFAVYGISDISNCHGNMKGYIPIPWHIYPVVMATD